MEFNDFLNEIDTILYGRKSYDLWGQFTPETMDDAEREMWNWFIVKKNMYFPKHKKALITKPYSSMIIFLKKLTKLKSKPGKDIWLYGGASLITTFINLGLIDEFRLSVHPVILGEGKPLFIDIKQRVNLNLVHTRTFSSGVVQLIYHWKHD